MKRKAELLLKSWKSCNFHLDNCIFVLYIKTVDAVIFLLDDAVLAQSVARRLGKAEVGGSSPLDSSCNGIGSMKECAGAHFFFTISDCFLKE